jgi:hypothetical protein
VAVCEVLAQAFQIAQVRGSLADCNYPSSSYGCADVKAITPVGYASLGAGLWGQFDLSGDVYEWTLDWYVSSYFDPCTDCAVVTATSGNSERKLGAIPSTGRPCSPGSATTTIPWTATAVSAFVAPALRSATPSASVRRQSMSP